MVKVVFMGTPDFAVPSLQKLIETQMVVGVVTQPDRPAGRGRQLRPSPVKVTAEKARIPLYQPKSLRSEESAVPLREWQPDLFVVAAFGQILRPHVLNLPAHGCINVHASLLPRWRGASPIQHAIMAGDSETGITLMRMDEGLDTGPIYLQESLPIHSDETAATLHDRLSLLGADLLAENLDDILQGRIKAAAQDNALSTYAPMINKDAGKLDWQRSSMELDRHIRAMTPWPGAYTSWAGDNLKILAARPVIAEIDDENSLLAHINLETMFSALPGQLITYRGSRFVQPSFLKRGVILVRTSDGMLILDKLQLAGKKAMSAVDFLQGRPEFAGAVLGG
jgi:methionyl-tRNA formyltransferase